MERVTLKLTDRQRAYLRGVRDRDPRPYLREKAAALLKVAAGASARAVALSGLLRPRRPETVRRWIEQFRARRRLTPRPACRRAFSPLRPGRGQGPGPGPRRAAP